MIPYLTAYDYDRLLIIQDESFTQPRSRHHTLLLDKYRNHGYIKFVRAGQGMWYVYITFKGIWAIFLYEEEFIEKNSNLTKAYLRKNSQKLITI